MRYKKNISELSNLKAGDVFVISEEITGKYQIFYEPSQGIERASIESCSTTFNTTALVTQEESLNRIVRFRQKGYPNIAKPTDQSSEHKVVKQEVIKVAIEICMGSSIIQISTGYTDMQKSIDGLYALVMEKLNKEPDRFSMIIILLYYLNLHIVLH